MEKDTPTLELVSIVIPTYNHARFLPRAIRSALGQDYPNVEIVVVDDGSTDATAQIVEPFLPNVRYVHQENQGLAGARNTGIRTASGSLVFFLDADDLMMAETLSKMLDALNKSPGTAMVACRSFVLFEPVDTDNLPDPVPAEQQEPKEIGWEDLVFGSSFPCTVLVRRSIFDDSGFFDASYGKLGCEDRDMWLRIAARHRILKLPDQLVYIVGHEENMSYNAETQLAGRMKCLRKARQSGVVPKWRLCFWGRVFAAHYFSACLMVSEKGQHLLAIGYLLLALVCYPIPGFTPRNRPTQRSRFKRLAVEICFLFGLRSSTDTDCSLQPS